MQSEGNLGLVLFRVVRDSCFDEVVCEQRPREVKECGMQISGGEFSGRGATG